MGWRALVRTIPLRTMELVIAVIAFARSGLARADQIDATGDNNGNYGGDDNLGNGLWDNRWYCFDGYHAEYNQHSDDKYGVCQRTDDGSGSSSQILVVGCDGFVGKPGSDAN